MAWYSLYKWFVSWRKTKYLNMIYYYSEYVLKSEEQRIREKEERKNKACQVMTIFSIMNQILNA